MKTIKRCVSWTLWIVVAGLAIDVVAQVSPDVITEPIEDAAEAGAEIVEDDPAADEEETASEASQTASKASQTASEASQTASKASQTASKASQTASEASQPANEVSRTEMAELEAALGADAEATEEVESTPRESGTVASAAQSMNPDISLILDVAGAYFTDEPDQVGAHDPSRTGFNLQQLEMHISSNVDPYFTFDANLVFAEFGVEVEEGYFTTLALPANLQVRGGQFLTRFGRLNPTHPHSWAFLDQPLVNGKFFGGEGSRGLGVETSWLTPLPWYVELVGSSTMANGECCARSFFGGNDPGVDGVEDLLYTTAIKQFFTLSDDWSLLWGLSAQFGPNSTGNENRTEIYGTDLYLKWRPVGAASRTSLSLQIEAMYRTRQVPDDRLEDLGGYAQLAWTINPEWQTAARYDYVTGVDDDYLEDEWFDDRQRAALQLTYFPSHFSRIRLQTSRDDAEYRDDAIWAVMLGVEVLVGAHGAHSY